MCILDHDDAGIDHGADGDGNAAEAHDVGIQAETAHRQKRRQHPDWQHQDRHQRTADVQQKQHTDQRDDQALLNQGMAQGGNSPFDQCRAVVTGDDFDPGRQAGLQLLQPGLDAVDHRQRILAAARHYDARGHFALAIELGQAAALVASQLDSRHIGHPDRRAIDLLEHQIIQILYALQITAAPHHEFGLRQLDDPTADLLIAGADGLHHRQW